MELSVVVPVYGSPQSLNELVERLRKVIQGHTKNFEIILINDGCPLNSWEIIKILSVQYHEVVGVNLSRNFGQHYAITAGLELSIGDNVIVMDCDLQDHPEEIPNLIKEIKNGYDLVQIKREHRRDSFLKKMSSLLFHKFLSYMTDTNSDESIANYGIYSRKVINSYLRIKEQVRSFPLHVKWLGFNSTTVVGRHNERHSGASSYTFNKLLNMALDLIISFSDKPLRIMVKFGLSMSLLSMILACYFFYNWYINKVSVDGWASLIVSIWFLSGVIIMMLGIVGTYVAKTFDESKGRPIYIIDEVIGK